MITTLKKQGNSRGVVFPPAILDLLKIKDETKLEVTTDGSSITLTPVDEEHEKVMMVGEKVIQRHHALFKRLASK